LDNKRLVIEKTNSSYQQEFQRISMAFMGDPGHEQWAEIYRKLVVWDLQMESAENREMGEVLESQKVEANYNFGRFVKRNYEKWLNDPASDKPLLSHQVMKRKVFPSLKKGEPVFMFLIDNLRFDQWKVIEKPILEHFNVDEESTYYSILPTTTAYARNAIFSGMMPSDMEKSHPRLWVGEDDDEGKNNFEDEFLQRQLQRNNLQVRASYHKIKRLEECKDLVENFNNLFVNDLNVIVYNFVDMLSHARTDMAMIRELAPDESAYRSITLSWFLQSPLWDMMKMVAAKKGKMVITTDHGTIRVKRPFKIAGERTMNTNLRYKQGRNLGYEGDRIMVASKPERLFLPKGNVATSWVFAVEDQFFAYPNNYNYYVNFYKDTFQHGGVSMEEMIVPLIRLSSRNG
ncbi:MAG: PglZ domain-containing protein, partial [Bacteroidota bacterium]